MTSAGREVRVPEAGERQRDETRRASSAAPVVDKPVVVPPHATTARKSWSLRSRKVCPAEAGDVGKRQTTLGVVSPCRRVRLALVANKGECSYVPGDGVVGKTFPFDAGDAEKGEKGTRMIVVDQRGRPSTESRNRTTGTLVESPHHRRFEGNRQLGFKDLPLLLHSLRTSRVRRLALLSLLRLLCSWRLNPPMIPQLVCPAHEWTPPLSCHLGLVRPLDYPK